MTLPGFAQDPTEVIDDSRPVGWMPDPNDRFANASPEAAWRGALAAWKAGEYRIAAHRFEAVANSGRVSPWIVSAGAFWAGRAFLFSRMPDQVAPWLEVAAEYPETFYGLLARRILGMPMPFRWTLDAADEVVLALAKETPEAARAEAAVAAGSFARAEQHLRALAERGPDMARGAMILAEQAGMADLAFRLNNLLRQRGADFACAAYPIPRWRPEGGFSTDPALVYALMRQESNFDPGAVSRAGARGVMQLMPSTARFIARSAGLPAAVVLQLRQPEVNIALGERYLELLLAEDSVGGDLFRLAAAWNGGPGNLERWQRGPADGDDPLLFIETIPSGETRVFIERVLANMWIYRHRLGRPSPSLDALAAGQWPAYEGEQVPTEIAEHATE